MSGDSRFRSVGAEDWVEQLRDAKRREPAPGVNEAVLEAAYNASEIDSAMMFAYFEGELTESERQELEAEIALSPHAFNKLARIGAIVAQSRSGSRFDSEPASPRHWMESSPSERQRVIHRVRLPVPRSSMGGHYLPRTEDCIRTAPDSPCEFYRSLEKNRDQLRIFHRSALVGTLVGVRILKAEAESDLSDASFTEFAVLRPSSETMTTATLTIPDSYRRGEVILELMEMPAGELSAEDSVWVLESYHKAAAQDPVAVTPLHEPRSAWQIWADQALKLPAEEVDPAVRQAAERIASF
jgi:anti-sigma factor RsiW